MIAVLPGECPRCHQMIIPDRSDIVFRHGDWIHSACAPGGDE